MSAVRSVRAAVRLFPPGECGPGIINASIAMDDMLDGSMECRMGCGACCIAPSISSPIPGMPEGKPAGVRCVQLSKDNRCMIFGRPERPAVCSGLRPSREMCGESDEDALARLIFLELATAPGVTGSAGTPL